MRLRLPSLALFGIAIATGLLFAALTASSAAAAEGTGWQAFVQAYPTYLHPGGGGTIQVDLMNTGAKPSSGPITVTDTLPEGLTATAAGGMLEDKLESEAEEVSEFGGVRWSCAGIGTREIACTSKPAHLGPLPIGAGDEFTPIERIGIEVGVEAGAAEGSFPDRATLAGGGATEPTEVSSPITISSSEPGYGLSGWDAWFTNADGSVDTRAGSHPYEATFAVGFNELPDGQTAGGEPRDLEAELPPGFFGEPSSSPACTRQQLGAEECPPDTQIGEAIPLFAQEGGGGAKGGGALAAYNMVPPPGLADQFAAIVFGKTVFFDAGPRGFGDYNIVTHIDNIPAGDHIDGSLLRLWGVASEPSHDNARDTAGPSEEQEQCHIHGCHSSAPPRPFLTLPTVCAGPQPFTIRGLGTWEDEGLRAEATVSSHDAQGNPIGFTGCSALSFNPSLSTSPDTAAADTPAGLSAELTMPQESLRAPEGLVESTIKNSSVTLPEGMVINPGQAAGLTACTEAQANMSAEGPASCPGASKVGTVRFDSPLLEGELEPALEGNIYVLHSSPPDIRLLLAASGDGVDLKVPAEVHLNEATGQLTTTLTETPPLPVSSVDLSFSGGAQAALATPTACGTYTTTSDFTPWTSPAGADAHPESSFEIDSGPGGSACPTKPLPFAPTMIAGSTSDQAGAFTDFSLLLRNSDASQRLQRLSFKIPPGLAAILASVPLCGEPQAAKGSCSAASQIGHTTVASGPGPYPLIVPGPGDPESPIYLTGPYRGAPLGLSIATPVIAGPFNLGTIVTRAAIQIDPTTAQITITTDPLPQIIDGVPTDLRLIDTVIDRPDFIFNPTNCQPSAFSGTAYGAPPPGSAAGPGATAPISSRFQVGSCRQLGYKPTLKLSLAGSTRRAGNPALKAVLTPRAGDANTAFARVTLPHNEFLDNAHIGTVCTKVTFNEGRVPGEKCPANSVYGHATAISPVLSEPLEGPVYLGTGYGHQLPDLVASLHTAGGIDIVLNGVVSSVHGGITNTFESVPDAPVTSFTLEMKGGSKGLLENSEPLCSAPRAKRLASADFTAHNGLTDDSHPLIGARCPKHRKGRRHPGRRRRRGRR